MTNFTTTPVGTCVWRKTGELRQKWSKCCPLSHNRKGRGLRCSATCFALAQPSTPRSDVHFRSASGFQAAGGKGERSRSNLFTKISPRITNISTQIQNFGKQLKKNQIFQLFFPKSLIFHQTNRPKQTDVNFRSASGLQSAAGQGQRSQSNLFTKISPKIKNKTKK